MMDKWLLEQLREYGESEVYPFHMPGHKRQWDFPNPFLIDITEIDGFDNLHHPEGILKDSMAWAAEVYGTKRTYYLVNGSSSGILSAISAVTEPGGTILISRNCHKAVYHGVFLNKLKTVYSYPQVIPEYGVLGGLPAGEIEELLISNREIQAVLIVSPTYDGVVSDVREIAEVVHRFGIPLIVDEAHGAHLPFGEGPKSALALGADIVIQSVHKTLPSLTQTAVLHVCSDRVDQKRLERYLQIYQSSSPSYVFMSSIEASINFMQRSGKQRLAELTEWIREMDQELGRLKVLKLVGSEVVGRSGVFAFDRTKLLISVPEGVRRMADGFWQPMDGVVLGEILRKDFQIEMEMTAVNYAVGLATCMDRREGFLRLTAALIEIDGQLVRDEEDWQQDSGADMWQAVGTVPKAERRLGSQDARIAMTIAEAWNGLAEKVLWKDCEGRVSAEFIYVYPPGIPIVAPGEEMTMPLIRQIDQYRQAGLTVHGGGEYLECVRLSGGGEE